MIRRAAARAAARAAPHTPRAIALPRSEGEADIDDNSGAARDAGEGGEARCGPGGGDPCALAAAEAGTAACGTVMRSGGNRLLRVLPSWPSPAPWE